MDEKPNNDKKGNPVLEVLTWWHVEDSQVKKQVDEYKTLKITQSARGMGALLLLIPIILSTIVGVALRPLNIVLFLEPVVFLIMAWFIFKGYRWAMIVTMILWTVEKALTLYSITNSVSSNGITIMLQLAWWAFYMRAFYLAFKVEGARKKTGNPGYTSN